MSNQSERRSISGIRGTADGLTAEKVTNYTRAYATLLRQVNRGNTVVVGRDTRPSSEALAAHAIDGLRGAGWDVIDVGVVPTPTVQIAIGKFEAAGGVVVTASHNPVEYNGIKFLQNRGGHGMFLEKAQCEELFRIYETGAFDSRRVGECRPVKAFALDFDDPPYTAEFLDRNRLDIPVDNKKILDYHIHRVVTGMGRELDHIRGMDFNVVMDCCGGAGIPINFVLLDHLYGKVKRVNDRPGAFTRPIEPTPRNLSALCRELAGEKTRYDVGFVTDCDNDRCVLIARDGKTGAYAPLEEDYTFAIAVDHVLDGVAPGATVVTNWSTSQLLYDVACAHRANLRRAPTGEVYTASEAIQYNAVIAGEGSCAGVMDPRVGMGRDVLVAIWHILGALAAKGRDLHALASRLPRYCKVNRDHASSRSVEETAAVLEELQQFYGGKDNILFINREDGLIVHFTNRSRIQIRSSNTEPILRIRSEAPDDAQAEALVQEALAAIGQAGAQGGKTSRASSRR